MFWTFSERIERKQIVFIKPQPSLILDSAEKILNYSESLGLYESNVIFILKKMVHWYLLKHERTWKM